MSAPCTCGQENDGRMFDGVACVRCDVLWCKNCDVPIPGRATFTPCCRKDMRHQVDKDWGRE